MNLNMIANKLTRAVNKNITITIIRKLNGELVNGKLVSKREDNKREDLDEWKRGFMEGYDEAYRRLMDR